MKTLILAALLACAPAWAFPIPNSHFVTKAGNYTALSTDTTIVFTANATLSLAAASTLTGKIYHVQTTGAAVDLTIDPNGAETICGQTTIQVNGDGDSIDFFSDGSKWVGLNNSCQRTIQLFMNSGAAAIQSQQGHCISAPTNPGTGRNGFTFTSGCFSAAPWCSATADETGTTNAVAQFSALIANGANEMRTRSGNTGTLTSSDWWMICRGPR